MHGGACSDQPFFSTKDQVFFSAIVPFLTMSYFGNKEVIYEVL
jgi:hypothetical protein